MATAIDIARYLIHLCANEEEPDYLSHMRLQKLLYYVQGGSLGLHGKPIFKERIEAWAHGPVVPEVYQTFKKFQSKAIPVEEGRDAEGNLKDDEKEFVESVWESYKEFSALNLSKMTHNEEPWVGVRRNYGPADRCGEEITEESMKSFFSRQAG